MSDTTNPGERGRFSSQLKTATVLRLLRGEDLELVSRELGVTAATLSSWRDDFLAGGQAALKCRPADDRDDEIARLRAKVGELTMDNELLLQRCRADRPFAPRRRRPEAEPSHPPPVSATGWPASAGSGTCPARRSTFSGIGGPSPSTSGRNPGGAVRSVRARTRNPSAASGASWPSRRSTARATEKSGPGYGTKASGPRRS